MTPLLTSMNVAKVKANELISLREANINIAKFIPEASYLCKDLGLKDPSGQEEQFQPPTMRYFYEKDIN